MAHDSKNSLNREVGNYSFRFFGPRVRINAACRQAHPALPAANYRPNNSVAVLRLHAVWNASPQVFTGLAVFRMSDRRRDKRWDVCLDAVWDSRSGNFPARVTDLSEGGCYIDSLNQPNVGEVLNLKLQLPNGDWLELTGEVAHQTPPLGFGLRFVELSEEQLKNLQLLIAHLQGSKDHASAILSY